MKTILYPMLLLLLVTSCTVSKNINQLSVLGIEEVVDENTLIYDVNVKVKVNNKEITASYDAEESVVYSVTHKEKVDDVTMYEAINLENNEIIKVLLNSEIKDALIWLFDYDINHNVFRQYFIMVNNREISS